MPDMDHDWDVEESKSSNSKVTEGDDLDWNDWDNEDDGPQMSPRADATPSQSSKNRAAELQAKRKAKRQEKMKKNGTPRQDASEGKQSEEDSAGYKGSANEDGDDGIQSFGPKSEGKESEDGEKKRKDLLQYFADDNDDDDDLDAIGGKRAVSPVTVMSMKKANDNERDDLALMESLMQQKEAKAKLEQKIQKRTKEQDCAIEHFGADELEAEELGDLGAFTKRRGLQEQLENIDQMPKRVSPKQAEATSSYEFTKGIRDKEDRRNDDDVRASRDRERDDRDDRRDDDDDVRASRDQRDDDRRDDRRGDDRRDDTRGSRDRDDNRDDRRDSRDYDRRDDRRGDDRDYDRRDSRRDSRDYDRRDDRRGDDRDYDRREKDDRRDYDRRDDSNSGGKDRYGDREDRDRDERGSSRDRDYDDRDDRRSKEADRSKDDRNDRKYRDDSPSDRSQDSRGDGRRSDSNSDSDDSPRDSRDSPGSSGGPRDSSAGEMRVANDDRNDDVYKPAHLAPLQGRVPHRDQGLEVDTAAVTSPGPASPAAVGSDYYAKLSDLDRSDMRSFLMAPAPKGAGVIQCYIKRTQNGKNKKNTTYQMFFQDDHKFMLYGRKMPKNRTSNYRVSMRDNDDSRDGPDFLGKVRAKNTWGTEFVMYDTGINPKDAENARGRKVRREFGVCHYETNVLGSRGPRKMHVGVPCTTETGEYKEFFFDELPARYKTDRADAKSHGFMTLINKPPTWNDSVGAHTLDFRGRVTMSSVKNFQLVEEENQESILVQFGRVEKEVFTLDFAYPFSAFQAFSTALSSFDSKLGCE